MNLIFHRNLPAYDQYFLPKTTEEAVSLLADGNKEAQILAGGTDLVVQMRNRQLVPKCIVNIAGLSELSGISLNGHSVRLGALATLRDVEVSPIVKKEFPLLHEAVSQMATVQVRNMGTLVGNLCHGSPGADTPPPLLALEADVKVAGPDGVKTISLDKFFTGPGDTVLNPNELVTEVLIPKLQPNSGTAFLRLTRVAADLAKVNVAVVLRVKNGICEDVKIALGAVAPTPIRARNAEEVLRGNMPSEKLIEKTAQTAADDTSPITDIRSTKEYRKEVSKVLVRRAINICIKRIEKGEEG